MIRRVALGVGANVLERVVVAGTQLLMVPVLAIHWGLAVYGGWTLLATIPSFLAISDFGFAQAAGTRMTMMVARGERDETVAVFQSAWLVVLLSSLGMAAMVALAVWLVPDRTLPSPAGFPPAQARATLLLLALWGIVSLQGSIFVAGFRCAGLFALSMLMASVTIAVESSAAIAVVALGGTPVQAAAALLGGRVAVLLAQAVLLMRQVPWLRFGFAQATRVEARALLAPALAVMMLPLAQASFLQGTALALGIAASALAVPAFTATRTLSRMGLQFTQLLNHALMPEYSAAVARDDGPVRATILTLTLLGAAVVLVPFALLLAIWGPDLVALWTHGVIRPGRGLMLAMAATVVLGGVWNPLSNLILAQNRHASYSYPFVVLALLTMPASYLLSRHMGATGAALSIVLLDAGMCVVILRLGQRMFSSPREVAASWRNIVARVRNGRIRSGI